MTKRISISAPERRTFTVDLVNVEYLVTAPKTAQAVEFSQLFQKKTEDGQNDPAAMVEGIKSFVMACFGKKQGAAVLKRLSDPDDALDFPQLTELVGALYEDETGDPPTSPRES